MGQLETAGPQVGQVVYYTPTAGTYYVGIITNVNATTGLIQLTAFIPGGTFSNETSVQYDNTGQVSNSWRYPDIGTGI